MAIRYVWLGSMGPFIYDDSQPLQAEDPQFPSNPWAVDQVADAPDNQSGLISTGRMKALEAPAEGDDVVRDEDLEELFERVVILEADVAALETAINNASLTVNTSSLTVVTSISVTKDGDGFVTNVSYNTANITYVTGVTLNI